MHVFGAKMENDSQKIGERSGRVYILFVGAKAGWKRVGMLARCVARVRVTCGTVADVREVLQGQQKTCLWRMYVDERMLALVSTV